VNQQTCYGETTTPKGRTRRTIPMTAALEKALRALETIREGFVVRNLDGSQKTDGQANAVILRIYRRAGLPQKRWHTLRHTFGTHAALFGVNPWRLPVVDGAQADRRDDDLRPRGGVPSSGDPGIHVEAGEAERDPDRPVLTMLGARGSHVAAEQLPKTKRAAEAAL